MNEFKKIINYTAFFEICVIKCYGITITHAVTAAKI